MTRFGKWFAGAIVLVVALLVIGLLMPRQAREVGTGDGKPVVAAPAPPAEAAEEDRPGPAILAASGLTVPVAGVRPADLVDTFGDPRGEGGSRGHGALDIMAPRGTPVLAAADGRVEKLFESDLGGHTVYIRSPNRRNVYYYAHLDTYAPGVREGVAVRAGQRIGTVGSTGDANPTAPHLHFEIKRVTPDEAWHEGRAINPYPLLAGRAAGG
ncbi:M23 family metallopeptidase [Sphingomonas solaris]|uniref:M23 family metallopeptidase n=1 Tax=Alterirhizorhabdus solaris TaxID=2529389 RepID=A0A558R729_9SPHN|nr:M23 family metallopeptidase [Sphingomonas solaris]TVV75193.1 M23 family metallopeptidase [Sphingomonas solaris]